MIDLDDENEALELPRFPSSSVVSAGQTLSLNIEFEPSVPVWGTIRTGDTDMPIPGAEIHIYYGTPRQGTNVISDANGRFEAKVLAGNVRAQVIVIPKEFRNYVQLGEPWDERIDIPVTERPFELPAIRLAPTVRVEGKVLLRSGAPAVNASVCGLYGNRRYGFGNTNDRGEFEMQIPLGIKFEKFQVWTDINGRSQDIKIKEGAPLILQIEEREALIPQLK
jgi:hypothetical protein